MTPSVHVPPASTDFRRRVYRLLLTIPEGRVTTYGALARALGCGSARAVGNALRHNPDAPRIPCHRVIASDGRLGGFKGRRHGVALVEKQRLLNAEGVEFSRGRLRDRARLWTPPAANCHPLPCSQPAGD